MMSLLDFLNWPDKAELAAVSCILQSSYLWRCFPHPYAVPIRVNIIDVRCRHWPCHIRMWLN